MPQLDGKNALFLFGINESGKSNLLKALSLLDRNSSAMKNFNYDRDCRKAAKRKNPSVEIKYYFRFDSEDEISEIFNIPKSLTKRVNLCAIKTITYEYSKGREEYWSIINNASPNYNGYLYNSRINHIEEADAGSGPKDDYKKLDAGDLENILKIHTHKLDEIRNILPKVIFWKASPEYLINQAIDLNTYNFNTFLHYILSCLVVY